MLILVLCLLINGFDAYSLYRKYPQSLLSDSFDWSYQYSIIDISKEIECLIKCTSNNECSIVSYNSVTKRCYLFKSSVSPGQNDVTFDSDNVLFVKKRIILKSILCTNLYFN
jgi:hypothetical protein